MLPMIERAKAEGWGVIIPNPNVKISVSGLDNPYSVSGFIEHKLFLNVNFNVCIVAHVLCLG